MNEELNFYREYSASPDQVWDALTNSDALNEWLMQGTFVAKEGYEYKFSEPGLSVAGTVLEVDPLRKLSYLWIGRRNDEEGDAGVASVVTWTLKPTKSGGTSVNLEHKLVEAAPPMVTIEASVNWSYAIHSSLALHLAGKYRQPVPIVYVEEKTETVPDVLVRAGFRQPEEARL